MASIAKAFFRTASSLRSSCYRNLSSTHISTLWACFHTHAYQQTLCKAVSRQGIGLHSGEQSTVTLMPATAHEGRYFVPKIAKQEGRQEERVISGVGFVVESTLSTSLGCGELQVRTVEHLLSALEGMGVHNCRIEIEGGSEVPILDGSSKLWVEAILEAGICFAEDSTGGRSCCKNARLESPIQVCSGDSFVAAFPSAETRITYGIDFKQVPRIGSQWFSFYPCNETAYTNEIAPARTFCIFEQVEQLRSSGLIKGGSIDNALVCSVDGWLNPPLRYLNEPCRHKLLDLIGDLALCSRNGQPGIPVAHIIAYKGSHNLHVKFGEALVAAMK